MARMLGWDTWNHILICLSVRQSACAISILLLLKRPLDLFCLGSEAWGQFIGPASEISIEVELLFKFESLVTRVGLPTPLTLCEGIVIIGSCIIV